MLGLSGFVLATLATLGNASSLFMPGICGDELPVANTASSPSLASFALQKVLNDAAPVFGTYSLKSSSNKNISTATWMKAYHDSTPITHLNLPGAHDAATWNYSVETQASLQHATALLDEPSFSPSGVRCQNRSLVDMLNGGLRVFDLRYAYDITNSTLVFWHGPGLMSETATIDDVLFGFYAWLEAHPSEAVFLSWQYQGSTRQYASNDAGVQMLLYQAFTTPAAQKYILQTRGSFGTLGEARGKVVLLKRFVLDQLPSQYGASLPGVEFDPATWTDNSPNITLIYNSITNGTASIEDYYFPATPHGSSAAFNIATKFNATVAHLALAATSSATTLFWSFASSTNLFNFPADTPEIQALGNGTELTPDGGVNQQLQGWLQANGKGKRLGILMLDFWEEPQGLVETFLGLLSPDQAAALAN